MDKRIQTINKVTKIFVPILILIVMVGIWYIKNDTGKAPSPATAGSSAAVETPAPNETETDLFTLRATAVELDRWKASGLPVLMVFGTESCPGCQYQYVVLEDLQAAAGQKAIIKYVDLSASPDAAEGYPVTVVPTLFFYDKNGGPYAPEDVDALGMILYYAKGTDVHESTAHEGALELEELLSVLKELGME